MKRLIIALAIAGGSTLTMTGVAVAETGPGSSCLGHDLSSYARFGSPGPFVQFEAGDGFGQFNAFLAQTYNGIAAPILTHKAGNTPDFFISNSCND